jgi:hypothetical protein
MRFIEFSVRQSIVITDQAAITDEAVITDE